MRVGQRESVLERGRRDARSGVAEARISGRGRERWTVAADRAERPAITTDDGHRPNVVSAGGEQPGDQSAGRDRRQRRQHGVFQPAAVLDAAQAEGRPEGWRIDPSATRWPTAQCARPKSDSRQLSRQRQHVGEPTKTKHVKIPDWLSNPFVGRADWRAIGRPSDSLPPPSRKSTRRPQPSDDAAPSESARGRSQPSDAARRSSPLPIQPAMRTDAGDA